MVEEAEKKGPCLVYQFPAIHGIWGRLQQGEHPLVTPKSNNLTKKEWWKAISMVVDMETKDSLKRYAIMVVAKKIWLTCADLTLL